MKHVNGIAKLSYNLTVIPTYIITVRFHYPLSYCHTYLLLTYIYNIQYIKYYISKYRGTGCRNVIDIVIVLDLFDEYH